MTYQERINAKANEIELLTAYANGVTGAEDTNIGDAIKTLCDWYGQGGGDFKFDSGVIINDSNYSYTSTSSNYTGKIVDTSLNRIDFVLIVSENYIKKIDVSSGQNRQYGMSITIRAGMIATSNASLGSKYYVSGLNATTTWYGVSSDCGAVLSGYFNNVSENQFGIKVHSTSYPMLAGVKYYWVAAQFPDEFLRKINMEE